MCATNTHFAHLVGYARGISKSLVLHPRVSRGTNAGRRAGVAPNVDQDAGENLNRNDEQKHDLGNFYYSGIDVDLLSGEVNRN
tara:strand:- start:375 stop:623 length:249 start_codon:yes stop_codon:yes gene_type:complete